MVSSRAVTVERYLAELPPARRAVVSAIRDVVNHHLPPGYVESMNWGMICWEIPLSRYPHTYNGHPLGYLALAAQKHNFALYSMAAYADPALTAWLREEFRRAGARLDMGKSCIRFASLEGLPLTVVERLASSATVEQYLEAYERSRHGRTKPARKPAPRKSAGAGAAAGGAKKAAPAARPAARKAAKRPARAKAKPAPRKPAKQAKRR